MAAFPTQRLATTFPSVGNPVGRRERPTPVKALLARTKPAPDDLEAAALRAVMKKGTK